jgi:hypothetical protein
MWSRAEILLPVEKEKNSYRLIFRLRFLINLTFNFVLIMASNSTSQRHVRLYTYLWYWKAPQGEGEMRFDITCEEHRCLRSRQNPSSDMTSNDVILFEDASLPSEGNQCQPSKFCVDKKRFVILDLKVNEIFFLWFVSDMHFLYYLILYMLHFMDCAYDFQSTCKQRRWKAVSRQNGDEIALSWFNATLKYFSKVDMKF